MARFGMRLGYAGYGELRQDLRNRWLALSMLITDSLGCPFVRLADHVLVSSSTGTLLVDSSIPAVFCVEALCDLVIQLTRQRVDTHVRRVHERTRAADFDDADATAEVLRRPMRHERHSDQPGRV